LSIRYISAEDTLELRQKFLRQDKPKSACIFEGDHSKSTKHIGAFIDTKCIGILSLFEAKAAKFLEAKQYQLRGMVVDVDYRGCGIGRQLVEFSQNELKAMRIQILWCNARVSATTFYLKLSFEFISKEFMIPDVGPHYRMSKILI
jgi:predicted GNAT family N-acyltransferase